VPRQQLPAYDPLLERKSIAVASDTKAGGHRVSAIINKGDVAAAFNRRGDSEGNLISGISYFAVWMVIWRGSLADMANVSD
jgi:hypothetical protein